MARVVGVAATGEELLEHVVEWAPDVVLQDLLLPGGIDGIETTRQVLALGLPVGVIALTASIDERARRRHREMEESGEPVSLPALTEEIARRDALDSSRPVSPLVPAPDAVLLDTSHHTPHQAIDEVLALVRARREDR